MNTNEATTNVNNLQSTQTYKAGSKVKHFHQFFTAYLIVIFLVIVVGLSTIVFFLAQEYKHSQTSITEQLFSLQTQYLQQTYLINADKLIDSILKNIDSNDLIPLQQALSLQSKKLSLLKSEYKNSYQQWFSSNNLAMDLLTRIESSHTNNELVKSKSLIQLDTLLDAINIQLNNQQTDSKQAVLLSKVENKLTNIVVMLKRLNLQTPQITFDQLSNKMDEMFVTDYAKQLANQQDENQGMADIVRDFIRFEDLILKDDLLAKWQDNLHLIENYKQQLLAQQEQLKKIIDEQLGSQQEVDSVLAISDYAGINKEAVLFSLLPIWVVTAITAVLVSSSGLLLLIRRKIKVASQFSVNCITRIIGSETSSLTAEEKDSFSQLRNHAFYSAETEQLIKKIQQINSYNHNEVEYLALTDKNQMLEERIIKFDSSEKSTSELLVEQQRCKDLHLAAIKQLVLLGVSSIATKIGASNKDDAGEADNHLNNAHYQGLDLVRQLRQASYYRYLQSSDALLTLSDVNLVALIQAVVLNSRNELILCNNKISVNIDEKILPKVNLDVALFSEMFSIFIMLLFSQQKNSQLSLNLQLVDKNNGQQKICFTGQIQDEDDIVCLPQALQAFSDDSTEQSELGDYFFTLLKNQHGYDVSAKLTEQAYNFSFTLPIAVADNQQGSHYPVLSLPDHLADIEKDVVKLAAKYFVRPIEVLLAVTVPEKYQRLQQLLQGMGLQITFVSCELMLQQHWQSGRFAVLITEIECQLFTRFTIDEGEEHSAIVAITRGVFSLENRVDIKAQSENYPLWVLGELSAESSVSELVTAMTPWIKEQRCGSYTPEEQVTQVTSSSNNIGAIAEDELALTSLNQADSFNFERYLKHQGSAELAIFMLEEYTTENIVLVEELSQAFTVNDVEKVDAIIKALLVNGRILAADHLLQLCQHWQTLLTTQGVDNNEKVQITLLSKTKQAVDEISQHAVTIA
ncbi:hypothetical protein [Colwellia sp. Bg11-28]|uniref:hypothetical protein n=1 Tax=Colwellia sp. Bg11-28 TaxID=2058305 RepID=UPI000C34128F|nr:hypothetical protein [Colwellia sp. Bg11-28]PKH88471.1 hypothetical protein CXF79_06890 [Colwellia sp. Bg11-28]